jgi:hypothetical protein
LVADAYMHMGLLPMDMPANSYSPGDFGSLDARQLPLNAWATLGPVTPVVFDVAAQRAVA